jgi:hypothetical protein
MATFDATSAAGGVRVFYSPGDDDAALVTDETKIVNASGWGRRLMDDLTIRARLLNVCRRPQRGTSSVSPILITFKSKLDSDRGLFQRICRGSTENKTLARVVPLPPTCVALSRHAEKVREKNAFSAALIGRNQSRVWCSKRSTSYRSTTTTLDVFGACCSTKPKFAAGASTKHATLPQRCYSFNVFAPESSRIFWETPTSN